MEDLFRINERRRAVQDNINKSFGFTPEEEIEKGKWNVGDTKVYQGVTYYVGGFSPNGTPLWRKKKDGQNTTQQPATQSQPTSAQTQQPDKKSSGGSDASGLSDEFISKKMQTLKKLLNDGDITKEQYNQRLEGISFLIGEKRMGDILQSMKKTTPQPTQQPPAKQNTPTQTTSQQPASASNNVKIDQAEYDKQYQIAKKQLQGSDKKTALDALNMAMNIVNSNIKKTEEKLKDLKTNRPGAKQSIAITESELAKYNAQKKAFEDALKEGGKNNVNQTSTQTQSQPPAKQNITSTKTQSTKKIKNEFSDSLDLAESIANFLGKKVKKVDFTIRFGNHGDYEAYTNVRDVYEIVLDENNKIQIGRVISKTKNWMNSQKNEIIIRTAKKTSNITGKKVFKWSSDALNSYTPGSDFKSFLDKQPYGSMLKKYLY